MGPARSLTGTLAHPTGASGLPADLLIIAHGTLYPKYGTISYGQFSVDELLQLAAPSGLTIERTTLSRDTEVSAL